MTKSVFKQLTDAAKNARRDANARTAMALAEKDIQNRRVKDQWAKNARSKADAAEARAAKGK